MTDIIQLLPDAIANQIAAGEVVQRPASVVKELMENAVDAKASRIQVIIKDSGKTLIQVVDDGSGMSETDARMCFERHATSKIRTSEDLFTIRTMGFRGEAMASIAAVAQVELKSRQSDAELGTCILLEGSQVKKQEPVAVNAGTSICVKNLFYNVPARRNFLKSNPVEMRHIIDEFQRIALSNSDITFTLYQNDLEIYNLSAGKLSHRIVGLFGKNYKEQLAGCYEDTSHIRVEGFIGKPEFAKKTRGEQFFFVNNRYIKSPYLNHAVQNAYEGLLPDESHPFYVLFIEIDPKHIDINVHPTKTEIKFDDERTVYAIIRAAVKQALGTHNITPSINFEEDVNFQAFAGSKLNMNEQSSQRESFSSEKNYERFRDTTGREQRNISSWELLFENDPSRNVSVESAEGIAMSQEEEKPSSVTFQSAANNLQPGGKTQLVKEGEVNTFQIHQQYIATQVKSGLMLINQQAAHERILYEKFMVSLARKSGASQQVLFPQTLELNPADFTLVLELEKEINALGFDFQEFGKSAIVISGVPTDVAHVNEKDVFEGLIEQFKRNKSELSISKSENMARSLAKRSALRAGQALQLKEMNALIDQLFACTNPNYAPNGQQIFVILDLNKISQFFN